jgi:hypothetical protein
MKTLGQIGPAAVPALLDMVGRYTDDPHGFSMWTCITYYRPKTLRPVFEQLSSDQVHRRRSAAAIVAVFVRDKQRLPADKELAAALAPLLIPKPAAVPLRRWANWAPARLRPWES